MKICHLTSAHLRDDTRIFLKQCTSLSLKYDTYLVVADGCLDEEINRVKILGVGSNFSSRFARMTKSVYGVYKRAKSVDADLYHIHDPELIFAGILLKCQGSKVVFDAHEDLPKQVLSKYWIKPALRYSVAKLCTFLDITAAKIFDGVVGATPSITSKFLKYSTNCITINNYPIEDELFGGSTIESGQHAQNKKICYVGGYSHIRGLKQVVEALDQVDVAFDLVGETSDIQLKKELEQMSGWQKVTEKGQLSRDKVANVMAESLAGVVTFLPVPNHVESQPNKLFEYMSAGLPVIASNFDMWREVVEANQCGICVDPTDPTDISRAIKMLSDNPNLAEKLGENGRNAIVNKYNWSNESKKLFKFYGEIL